VASTRLDDDEDNVISRSGMFAPETCLVVIAKGEQAMSTRFTLGTLAVLFAVAPANDQASAQTCFPAFPTAPNGQLSQTVNRVKPQTRSNARAQATLPSRRETPIGTMRDDTAYHGHFTLPEFDPEYHGSNGG
jgi:hypothetical protein